MAPELDHKRLSTILKRGQLDVGAVLELGIKLCVALREVHAKDESSTGVPPDRELSPRNVWLTDEGAVVADELGVSDGLYPGGTTTYRAPEQMRGRPRNPRSDVFAVGTLLYEAATGHPLFSGNNEDEIRFILTDGLEQHLMLQDVVGELNGILPGLGEAVTKALDAEPMTRWSEPAALGAQLVKLLSSGPRMAAGALARAVQETPSGFAPAPEPPPSLKPPSLPDVPELPGIPELPDVPELPELPGIPELPDLDTEPEVPDAPSWLVGLGRKSAGEDEVVIDEEPHSVELSMPNLGRRVGADAPVVPLEQAGDRFELQSEVSPEPKARPKRRAPPPELPPLEVDRSSSADTTATRLKRKKGKRNDWEAAPFREAVFWFIKRVLLYSLLVLTLLFAIAYLGAFPAATSHLATEAWELLPEVARTRLPADFDAQVRETWALRKGGTTLAGAVPEGWEETVQKRVTGEDQEPAVVDAGLPEGSGVIHGVAGWVEPREELNAGLGELRVDVELGGKPVGPRALLRATQRDAAAAGDDDSAAEPTAAIEGPSDQFLVLPPGTWDVEIIYSESEESGRFEGLASGLEVHAGHRTWYRASMSAPVGFLEAKFTLDAVDISPEVTLSAWAPGADRAQPPRWSGPAGGLAPLPEGTWDVQGRYDDTKHVPTEIWFEAIAVPGDAGVVTRKATLALGEVLNPTGPGVRITATNFGDDVSDRTQVYLYVPGQDVRFARATASGKGAFYFDVPPGEYDLRLVFQPGLNNQELQGEAIVKGVQVEPDGILRESYEIGFPYGSLDVKVLDTGRDVSDEVRVVVIGPGASFEGATRVIDQDLGRPHFLPIGSYDVYLLYGNAELGQRQHVFSNVKLKHGKSWKQEFTLQQTEWVAR